MKAAALTIAGSDPSGGAGLQADLKTFHQHHVYGMSVVTLLTVQNTQEVRAVEIVPARMVRNQLQAVIEDIPPQAAKTGALGNAGVIETVAKQAEHFSFPLVVDPVMISKHGAYLMDEEAVEVVKRRLLPCAFLVTPNFHEAKALANQNHLDRNTIQEAAKAIAAYGPRHVLIKGGKHVDFSTDWLWSEGELIPFTTKSIETKHTHGTGCAYSAAITANLALGKDLSTSVQQAKEFITRAIETHPGLGQGYGPVNHHA